ncbi:Alpha-acetolactate decarboxylase precursor [Novipirellula aureliae]|uniref:Alpha-acetolactate decarboxylase n=1 Tax=Novipirellula aureliae TaxID=2527966 RepID=A0A5C6E4I7_9BACT|nr:acetolactate decarboxylase [Novipirellula aureliae]TWU43842.1 Alpha-acetolactate decarboxylase precursor [Novipirellula aureliae]
MLTVKPLDHDRVGIPANDQLGVMNMKPATEVLARLVCLPGLLCSVLLPASFGYCQDALATANRNELSASLRQDRSETYFQYSIWGAFVNKVFEGDLSVAEMKKRGDVGLGSYTLLEGELVMLDGIPYRIEETGVVSVPKDEDKIVYANAAFFDEDASFEIPEINNYEMLRQIIRDRLPSLNYFYAFKITGTFESMKCGGLSRQEPPFKDGLDILIPNRPVFERQNFKGTLIGFYCPGFIGDINVEGFHFHFISDDKQFGGHAMEFKAKDLHVAIDKMKQYTFVLPESEKFEAVEFDKQFQYQQK